MAGTLQARVLCVQAVPHHSLGTEKRSLAILLITWLGKVQEGRNGKDWRYEVDLREGETSNLRKERRKGKGDVSTVRSQAVPTGMNLRE